jgi:ADP-ribose pyrophosphatase
MTTANMKLVIVGVSFPGELELPEQKLEPGESIVRRVVELAKLGDEIKGLQYSSTRQRRTYQSLPS